MVNASRRWTPATSLSVADHMLTALKVLVGQSAVAVRPACAAGLWDRIQSHSYASSSSSSSSSEFGGSSLSSSSGDAQTAGTSHADQPGTDAYQELPVQQALVDQVRLQLVALCLTLLHVTLRKGPHRMGPGCPFATTAHPLTVHQPYMWASDSNTSVVCAAVVLYCSCCLLTT